MFLSSVTILVYKRYQKFRKFHRSPIFHERGCLGSYFQTNGVPISLKMFMTNVIRQHRILILSKYTERNGQRVLTCYKNTVFTLTHDISHENLDGNVIRQCKKGIFKAIENSMTIFGSFLTFFSFLEFQFFRNEPKKKTVSELSLTDFKNTVSRLMYAISRENIERIHKLVFG